MTIKLQETMQPHHSSLYHISTLQPRSPLELTDMPEHHVSLLWTKLFLSEHQLGAAYASCMEGNRDPFRFWGRGWDQGLPVTPHGFQHV